MTKHLSVIGIYYNMHVKFARVCRPRLCNHVCDNNVGTYIAALHVLCTKLYLRLRALRFFLNRTFFNQIKVAIGGEIQAKKF
jgi:hypothetical protein